MAEGQDFVRKETSLWSQANVCFAGDFLGNFIGAGFSGCAQLKVYGWAGTRGG